MKYMKKILLFTLLLLTLFIPLSSYAADSSVPTTYAPAAILMDAKTGKILYDKNANQKMYPASTTKIMTAILALEHRKLTDVATVSHDAIFTVPVGYSNANLQVDEELTYDQLLHVLLIPSANDAANVIAEDIAGSVESFATMMNTKAIDLGCTNTHFVNPNGVHNENHYSTAYDLALMGKYAMQNSIFRELVYTKRYTLPATNKYDKADRIFNTTNELIKEDHRDRADNYYYEYATGAKTGYTDAAKNCIVATAEKDGFELIVVVLGEERTENGLNARAIDCKNLFNYGFNNYSIKKIREANDTLKQIQVSGATKDTKNLDVILSHEITVLTKNSTDITALAPTIEINPDLKAPLSKGTIIGKITYTVDGVDYSSELVAANNVYKSDFIKVVFQILLAILILFVLSTFLKTKKKKNRKKKKKKHSSHKKQTYSYIDRYK